MPNTHRASARRGANYLIAGAAATAVGGVVVQAGIQPASSVSDDLWSYPWSPTALVPISILWAALHVLVFAGLLGFARSGLAGDSRSARIGVILALAGTALLFVGELASIPVRHQHVDDTGATVVGALFGAGMLLSAVGLLTVGVATLRARLWSGWGRFTPLVAGIWTTALLGVASTKALPAGVALYGLCLLAVGVALRAQLSPSRAVVMPHAPREQHA